MDGFEKRRSDPFMTVPDVANRWVCSLNTVLRLVKTGKLTSFRVNHCWRVPLSSVVKFEELFTRRGDTA